MRASTTRAPGHRIDAEPVPREIGERQTRDDLDVDARAAQQHHRAFRDRRAARHRVRDLAVLLRGLDDARRDRGVHGVEIVAGVVEQVERLEHQAFAREIVDRGVAGGAHVADRDPLERGAGRGQQQVDAGRTETDHDDAGSVHPPASGVVVVVAGAFSRAVRGSGTAGGVTRYRNVCC